MDVRLTWTDCGEAGDYVVPNVLSPRDLVSRLDNMEKTVLHDLPFPQVRQVPETIVLMARSTKFEPRREKTCLQV